MHRLECGCHTRIVVCIARHHREHGEQGRLCAADDADFLRRIARAGEAGAGGADDGDTFHKRAPPLHVVTDVVAAQLCDHCDNISCLRGGGVTNNPLLTVEVRVFEGLLHKRPAFDCVRARDFRRSANDAWRQRC